MLTFPFLSISFLRATKVRPHKVSAGITHRSTRMHPPLLKMSNSCSIAIKEAPCFLQRAGPSCGQYCPFMLTSAHLLDSHFGFHLHIFSPFCTVTSSLFVRCQRPHCMMDQNAAQSDVLLQIPSAPSHPRAFEIGELFFFPAPTLCVEPPFCYRRFLLL